MIATIACSRENQESLRDFIEYKVESENYVRWSKEQQITWDLFTGDREERGIYYNYFGLYFFYDLRDGLKFNATVFFDRKKSWVRPKEDWGESAVYYLQAQKLLKLKFDYYEVTIRKLRKYLIENKNKLKYESQLRSLGNEYLYKAESEWNDIENEIKFDLSDNNLEAIRKKVDADLDELSQFDARVNNSFD